MDEPDEDVLQERQSTVNAIAYEFMKLFGATTKNGWTHDQMQPMFDATREIITRTFPVLVELDTAAAAAAPVGQSEVRHCRTCHCEPCDKHEYEEIGRGRYRCIRCPSERFAAGEEELGYPSFTKDGVPLG